MCGVEETSPSSTDYENDLMVFNGDGKAQCGIIFLQPRTKGKKPYINLIIGNAPWRNDVYVLTLTVNYSWNQQ